MIGWLRRMLRRDREAGPGEDLKLARKEHRAAIIATTSATKHVNRVIVERHKIDAMMREADASMFGERMEHR